MMLLFVIPDQKLYVFGGFCVMGHRKHNINRHHNQGLKSGLFYLCNLLEVIVAFLQCSCSVQRLPHTAVFVQENLTMLLHPVQHLRVRQERVTSI